MYSYGDGQSSPTLCPWRCNLTALSQRCNIYLIASNTVIHVYRPSFPSQSVSKPELVIHPPSMGRSAPGVFQANPLSINRILVDYLGNEEILLLVRDDGDVIGYRIEEIHRALERRTNQDEPTSEDNIPVFLHRNVGGSAWGLAIHREARIIAISANTHCVTVIAYALDGDPARKAENVFTLYGVGNMPAICFTVDSGNFLLSAGIKGEATLWDLRVRNWASEFKVGYCKNAVNLKPPKDIEGACGCRPGFNNNNHAIWGVMALDTRSAYEFTEAKEEQELILPAQSVVLDVTDQKYQFVREEDAYICPGSGYENVTEYVADHMASLMSPGAGDTYFVEFLALNVNTNTEMTDSPPEHPTQYYPHIVLSTTEVPLQPYCEANLKITNQLSKPFLIISKEAIFLVQYPEPRDTPKDKESFRNYVVAMRRPLQLGKWTAVLHPMDRLCYFEQIPELGVFLVGSPLGRVGVFTLYWTKDKDNPQPRYGFRLEHMLPYRHDGDGKVARYMGISKLIGLAVGPVQGMFDQPANSESEHGEEEQAPQPRRWRVLLHYTDSTVLSFELSKRRESNSPGLDEIIV
ncbi:ribonucleotide reductase transcriptional regulator crt10 [Pyrenophora seminiperda CCB06]|uniref:Ribonucleotide reductase transcriptional regulator crt10 n=1 Tax=Pyrenophora seminiperda CCB06 TaxID=1302712 RepID=A0A3M7ME89_9PLEO|nr:ribonucleotide reductase transcriptional regulator crt10 [Pyrenophora seminiperda CCB06]